MNRSDVAVELRAVSRRYASGRGISGLDLSLGPGLYGVLGPNGAGKTTLLEVLATAAPASEGAVRLWGRSVEPRSLRDLRRHVGYLPQDPTLPAHLRVGQYLEYVAVLREIDGVDVRRREVDRVLGLVHLRERACDRIRALSGGMRQRVALARALLGSPRLLVLDEPTVGLDPGQRVVLRDALLAMADEDVTVIVSSHQTGDLEMICSNLIVVDGGTCRWTGPLRAFAEEVAGMAWVSDAATAAGAVVSLRLPDGRYRHLGAAPEGVATQAPTIEDAYLLLLRAPGEAPQTALPAR